MNKTLNRSRIASLLGATSAIALSVLMTGCAPKNGGAPGADSTASMGTVERGKYLVTTTGCNDCHTPWTMGPQGPAPDMTKMLSGHPAGMPISPPAMLQPPWMAAGDMTMTAWSGPWGVSFTANLTPDSATGIGKWTQDQFISTLKNGKHLGTGRTILPPMPWNWFAQMTDADLASIYLYLKSIPPISNHVPDPLPPAPAMPTGMPPGAMGMPGMPPLPPGAPVPPLPPPPHHK